MQGSIGNSCSQIFADDDVKPVITSPPSRITLLGGGGDQNHSDSDERKVPEILVGRSSSVSTSKVPQTGPGDLKKSRQKRKALPAEKEHKRIKRLLRNRVSAQQARERKKAYLSDLEARTKELEQKNVELEEKVSTLQQENVMLRKVIRSTTIRSSSTCDK